MTFKIPKKYISVDTINILGFIGVFNIPENKKLKLRKLRCLASLENDELEHVSVVAFSKKMQERTPTWDEMCRIKSLFWDDEDCVFQLHPKASEYVNVHQHVLHLWRYADGTDPLKRRNGI